MVNDMYSLEELNEFEDKAKQGMNYFKKNNNFLRVDDFELKSDFKKKVLSLILYQVSYWGEGDGVVDEFTRDPIHSIDVPLANLTPSLFLELVVAHIDALKPAINKLVK